MPTSVKANQEHVVAFIDIGTYSVRLLIARFDPNQSYVVLNEQKEPARLGAGEIFVQRLEQEAMRRTALICAKFVDMARGFNPRQIIAVATAATRDARNKRQFLRLLHKETGLDVRVISGQEEARLIYLGVSRGMHLDGQNALFIDVGGGSTELIAGDDQDYQFLGSLRIGSIRLSQAFQLNDPEEPISPARYARACNYVRDMSVRAVQTLRKHNLKLCVGSSGTVINLMEIAARRSADDAVPPRNANAASVTRALRYEDLRDTARMLCSLPLEARRKVPGINANRADILIGGAAIIETVMGELKIDQIQISPHGLRDGLLIDYLGRDQPTAVTHAMSVRKRSVLLLARRCRFDEDHAQHVTRLTLALYDAAGAIGLHKFTAKERELLEYAALLHDIGMFLSFHNHHAHTYYLIQNADLVGFDQTEIAVLAAIARYHRKSTPRKTHPEVADLTPKQVKQVRQLSMLLRIAETLDRSHAGVIESLDMVRVDKKNVSLELRASGDCALELWGMHKHAKAFTKAFRCLLSVNLVTMPPDDDIPNAPSPDHSTTDR